jgi:hypothetical protein
MSGATLRLAIERGEIEADHPLANGPWVINRSALETAAALQFAERVAVAHAAHVGMSSATSDRSRPVHSVSRFLSFSNKPGESALRSTDNPNRHFR